jgi:oxygen-independent coproporphyrinogen-3 oxidase
VVRAEDDRYAEEFLAAHDTVTSAGLDHYEVSNFGKPDKHSRHNSAYWTSNSYLGIGPSAHSFDGSRRWWNERSYASWLDRVNQNRSPVVESEELTEENRAAERIYLGLRTTSGLDSTRQEMEAATRWAAAGWADIEGNTVRLTPEGWLRLDSLASQLTVV